MPYWNYKAYIAAGDHFLCEVIGSSRKEETPPDGNEKVRAPWADGGRKTKDELKPHLIYPHASESTELTQTLRGFHYNSTWKELEFREFGEHIPLNDVAWTEVLTAPESRAAVLCASCSVLCSQACLSLLHGWAFISKMALEDSNNICQCLEKFGITDFIVGETTSWWCNHLMMPTLLISSQNNVPPH